MLLLPRRHNGDGDLGGVSRVQDDAAKGVQEEPAHVALEERLGHHGVLAPRSARIEFFSKHLSAPFALTVRLVECLKLLHFGGKLVLVAFDGLKDESGVQFFYCAHA